jgi:hypothetical protein
VENTKSERRVLEIVNHPFIVSLHYAFQVARRHAQLPRACNAVRECVGIRWGWFSAEGRKERG